MKNKIDNKYVSWALTALSVIGISILFAFLLFRIDEIVAGIGNILKMFTPLIYGIVIAFLLNLLYNYFDRRFIKLLSKKYKDKDKIKKIARWQKISEVAAKQCGRDIIPKINNVINIQNICNLIPKFDILLVAYENERKNALKENLIKCKDHYSKNKKIKIGVVIGPEGGLEEKDVELLKDNGAKIITLGKRILRTETVALSILSIIMYELEN